MGKWASICITLFSIILITIIFLDVGLQDASAEISFPSNNFRLEDQPTYCIITPNASQSQAENLIDMAKIGITEWKTKLQAAELNNKLLWDIKYKLVDSGSATGCDISIYFKPTVEQLNLGDITTLGVFYHATKSIEVAFKDVDVGNIYNILIHEIGHSLGLGHYFSDDDALNEKWSTGNTFSPSIMIPITHDNPSLMTITDVDVLKVRQIYGSKGFSAFSTEPLPEPIPIPTPEPTPTPIPTQPIIPVFPFESLSITQQIIEVGRYEQQQFVKIIGDISEDAFQRGLSVYFIVKHPDDSFQTLKITPTRKGHFETTLVFDDSSVRGTYKVEANYLGHHDRDSDFIFRVIEKGTITKPIISTTPEVTITPEAIIAPEVTITPEAPTEPALQCGPGTAPKDGLCVVDSRGGGNQLTVIGFIAIIAIIVVVIIVIKRR